VALHILAALIEKVPRDLPIYARSVMTVIETVLRSNDINMVEESIVPFETFCRYQDIAAIAADQGLAFQYREVVRIYASLSSFCFQLKYKVQPASGHSVEKRGTASYQGRGQLREPCC
jgi:hypothetical protein